MSGTETETLPAGIAIPEPVASLSSAAKESAPLTPGELAKRLKLGSIELVAELWALTQKQVDAEISRQTRLEGKATSLLTAVGLSLTVAFTFGSTLITQTEAFKDFKTWLVLSYGAAIIAGLVAAIFATGALLLFQQRQVSEDMLFNESILKASDVNGTPDEEKAALIAYRQAAIIHFWGIRQRYDETYREKAKLVKVGQIAFMCFLACLFSLCIPIVIAVISKG